ncbi:hypothetical protein [Mitsuaria sp. GD03876]|uniref:hypothetical protein n=1 Tax=Mitsuaria sp. GD03876 TaxID=2975399 RepID=UPI00244C56BE|nr:hypothetical protein [Mitsuaria sp. GD03876]MDH0866200.1 hypothetical protein [Mitsuaria sp. GD03876]
MFHRSSARRTLRRAALLSVSSALCLLLNGCGGGGSDDCDLGNGWGFSYSPSEVANPGFVLTYKQGVANRWTLNANAMNAACTRGLKVTMRPNNAELPGGAGLPNGITLNAGTGEFSSPVLTAPIEGICQTPTGGIEGLSKNRVCPAGQVLTDRRFVIDIQTDVINTGANPVPTLIYFRPAP